jgi:cytochrome c
MRREIVVVVVIALGTAIFAAAGSCRPSRERVAMDETSGNPARGAEMVRAYGCNACHTVRGVPGPRGTVGPALDSLATQSFIAGHLPNDTPSLIAWIRHPREIVPGTAMPDLNVTERDARDIAAFLTTRK